MPSASLEDSCLDQGEETITKAQELSVNTEMVNSLEPQFEIEIENGVSGIETIPCPQEVVDSATNVQSLDVTIVSTIKQESADKTISTEHLSVAQKLSAEENNNREGVLENAIEKITPSDARDILPEDEVLGIAQPQLSLEDENVCESTPNFASERGYVSHIEHFRLEGVIDLSGINELSLEENLVDHEDTIEVKTISEVTDLEILSEGQKEGGLADEFRLKEEQDSELIPNIAVKTESVAQDKEIPFEEEKVFSVTHELRFEREIVSNLRPEFALQIETVRPAKDISLLEVTDVSNVQEVTLKQSNRDDVQGHVLEEETDGEVGDILSEHEEVTEVITEMCFNDENFSELVSDLPVEMGSAIEVKEISSKEVVAHHLALEDEIVSVSTPELTFETNAVNHVNEVVVEEVKELSNILESALKETICEEIADISNLEETAEVEVGEMLSEEVRKDEIIQELCIEKEQVSKIVPDTANETECITQIKGIPFEEDRVSGVITHPLTLEDEIVSVLTPELTVQANAVNIVKEVVVEEVKELSNIQDLALKENICEEVPDFANLEETEDEERELLSEEVKVDKIVQELVIDREQVSKIVPDIADETDSISQVKEIQVAGDRVFGITHEISLKEGNVRKLTSECAHDLETIKEVKEIPVEKSVQEFYSEKPTELNAQTPDSDQVEKENHFEDTKVEHSSDESTKDKQDVRECTNKNASDIESITSEAGEILLGKDVPGMNSDKTSLKPSYKSEPGGSKEKQEEHNGVREYLQENQTVNLVTGDISVEDVGVGNESFSKNDEMIGEVKDVLIIEEKNDPPDKNPKGAVVSGKIWEVENSPKDSYQTTNFTAQPSHNLDKETSTKRYSTELNASAKEFVPGKIFTPESFFRGADDGPSSMKNIEKTGAHKHSKNESRLNAEAKEYVPSTQARLCEVRVAGNSQSENILSMFAGEFVPSHVNTNAASHPRFPHQITHAPAMRPVYRPAPPRPAPRFRPRGHARMQHRRPAGRFPPNQPRMRFRPRNPPNNVRWPSWSSFD